MKTCDGLSQLSLNFRPLTFWLWVMRQQTILWPDTSSFTCNENCYELQPLLLFLICHPSLCFKSLGSIFTALKELHKLYVVVHSRVMLIVFDSTVRLRLENPLSTLLDLINTLWTFTEDQINLGFGGGRRSEPSVTAPKSRPFTVWLTVFICDSKF